MPVSQMGQIQLGWDDIMQLFTRASGGAQVEGVVAREHFDPPTGHLRSKQKSAAFVDQTI